MTNLIDFDIDFNIPTALKGWVGPAPQGRGVLHIIIHCALQHYFQVVSHYPKSPRVLV